MNRTFSGGLCLRLFLLILSLYAVTACQRGPEPAPSQPEIQPQTTAESVTVPTLRPSQTPAPSQSPTKKPTPSPSPTDSPARDEQALIGRETIQMDISLSPEPKPTRTAEPTPPPTPEPVATPPPPAEEQQTGYVGRIGGTPKIIGQYQNYLYVALDEELLIYEVAEFQDPKLLNRIVYDLKNHFMIIHKDRALLTQYGFEYVSGILLDLTDPINPKSIGRYGGVSGTYAVKEDHLFYRTGSLVNWISSIDFYPENMTITEPLAETMLRATKEKIFDQLREGKDVEELNIEFDDLFIRGNLIGLQWYLLYQNKSYCEAGQVEFPCSGGYVLFDITNVMEPEFIELISRLNTPERTDIDAWFDTALQQDGFEQLEQIRKLIDGHRK